MTAQNKKTAADIAAENETHIAPIQLLKEIEIYLKEYYIADFELIHNKILMHFKNGQSFIITVGEVV